MTFPHSSGDPSRQPCIVGIGETAYKRRGGHAGTSEFSLLLSAIRSAAADAGIKASAIKVAAGCTSCHPQLFFSHRASSGHAGRMFSVIGIRR